MSEFDSHLVPVSSLKSGDVIQFDTSVETKVMGIVIHTVREHKGKITVYLTDRLLPGEPKAFYDYYFLPIKEVMLIGQVHPSALGLDSDNY